MEAHKLVLILFGLLVFHQPCALANIEEMYEFFIHVVHCIQSIQQNPMDGHFTELLSHTRTIHILTSVVRRDESPESRECAALSESLHSRLMLILQQPPGQAGIIIPPTARSGGQGRPRYNLTAEQSCWIWG